jgi:hypothetical protein
MSDRTINIIAALVILFIPFPSLIVPNWRFRVVDVNGNICANRRVTESWAHYSIYIDDGNSQTENRQTNGEGYVEFPARKVWAPLIWRVIGSVIAHVLIFAHGSAGPNASIWATGLKDKAWIDYESEGLVDKMVVHQCVY